MADTLGVLRLDVHFQKLLIALVGGHDDSRLRYAADAVEQVAELITVGVVVGDDVVVDVVRHLGRIYISTVGTLGNALP